MRTKIFNDPFYKQDRSHKNLNKVVAAKRRKRDGTGKFNFEEADNLQKVKDVVIEEQAPMRPQPAQQQDQQSIKKNVMKLPRIDITKVFRQQSYDSEPDNLAVS